ncbi:MAG: tetratricopeptide repeat protein [Bacteroidota bacterium]
MKRILFIILIGSCSPGLTGQPYRSDIRQGNRYFKDEKFVESETAFRKALEEDHRNTMAAFNLGDALYRQEKFDDAQQQFESISDRESNKINSSKAFHNLGNANLQAGKIDESIEAYKEALRRNPTDMDTKYNLAFAQHLKKQQQQQQQNQDNQDQKNNQKSEENKQDQNKDQQQQQQQQQQQNKPSDQQEKQPSQQAKISKEDAKRLLEAIANDEKKVQDKVKKQKAAAVRTRSIKDW